jgi:hypothetical protein
MNRFIHATRFGAPPRTGIVSGTSLDRQRVIPVEKIAPRFRFNWCCRNQKCHVIRNVAISWRASPPKGKYSFPLIRRPEQQFTLATQS